MSVTIPMVDLKGQYEKIKTEINNGINEVIESSTFIKGPKVKEFENQLSQYLNIKQVIACANGTDALQIALMALQLQPGDEVIIPCFTYIATAEVIALLGLKPILIDVEANYFCIDPQLIESKITNKTKAIVPVHLFGQCANMNQIIAIANKHNIYVIEDTAQAIGAGYILENNTQQTSAGGIGVIGTTSFFPSKNLGCYGDGGALFTNDEKLARQIRMICNHGQEKQYVHDIIGVNSRLDSIQAAVLLAKLPHLNTYAQARNQVANWYDELLSGNEHIIIPKRDQNSTHVFNQYTIQLEGVNRDSIKKHLTENNIASAVYYPHTVYQQKAFSDLGYQAGDFPVAEKLTETVLSLPMHTEMTQETATYIAKEVLAAINKHK
ncbi:MAG: DegT/DnrJ/EryC1/StrS family aminotransferase [Bacteroidota bacterium]